MDNEWKFLKEVHSFGDLPDDLIPEFIFWGRSNVGKSTLINLLTKSQIAKTSRLPGRTRSFVLFQYKKTFRIIDLPGYGFSKIPKKTEVKIDKLLNEYLIKRINLKKIFILVDSRHLLKNIDLIIIKNLEGITDKEIVLVFTKTDKLKSRLEKKIKYEEMQIIKNNLNKNFFNTSNKEINGIVLLKKFLFKLTNDNG